MRIEIIGSLKKEWERPRSWTVIDRRYSSFFRSLLDQLSGLLSQFCNGRQRLSRVLQIADRGLESEPDFPGGFEHIKTLGVDAGHLRRSAPAIVPQRIAMVIVDVLNDSRFPELRKMDCAS
jgi:hypothetical protein